MNCKIIFFSWILLLIIAVSLSFLGCASAPIVTEIKTKTLEVKIPGVKKEIKSSVITNCNDSLKNIFKDFIKIIPDSTFVQASDSSALPDGRMTRDRIKYYPRSGRFELTHKEDNIKQSYQDTLSKLPEIKVKDSGWLPTWLNNKYVLSMIVVLFGSALVLILIKFQSK